MCVVNKNLQQPWTRICLLLLECPIYSLPLITIQVYYIAAICKLNNPAHGKAFTSESQDCTSGWILASSPVQLFVALRTLSLLRAMQSWTIVPYAAYTDSRCRILVSYFLFSFTFPSKVNLRSSSIYQHQHFVPSQMFQSFLRLCPHARKSFSEEVVLWNFAIKRFRCRRIAVFSVLSH